jgi:fumarylacetoacetase
VSGPTKSERGSLVELTWRGAEPLELPDGTTRTFLEDGDTVTLRGWCGGGDAPRIGFGEATGTIVPTPDREGATR